MRHASAKTLGAVWAAGFVAVVVQVLLLRECLSLFTGYEPSLGFVLASWLCWTGLGAAMTGRARFLARAPTDLSSWIAGAMALLALLAPASLLAARGVRPMLGLGLGETPGLFDILVVSLSLPAPFTFAMVRLPNMLWAALLCGLVTTAAGALQPRREPPRDWAAWLLCMAAATLVVAMGFAAELERASRRWQWGAGFVEAADTERQNLVATRDGSQLTLFAQGAWAFTSPDPQRAEFTTHLALLQHPGPRRVLIIGGDPSALIDETLKHPSVELVDYLSPDPGETAFVARALHGRGDGLAMRSGARLLHQDAAAFARNAAETYDVALLQAPEPTSAGASRFLSGGRQPRRGRRSSKTATVGAEAGAKTEEPPVAVGGGTGVA